MYIKNANFKLLYDKKLGSEYILRLKKIEKGEKVSIISNSLFKTMFYNSERLKYSVKLLSYFIDMSFEELLSNIQLYKNEVDKDKNNSKEERCDYVAKIGNDKINIEVNNNSDYNIMKRNMDYAYRLYSDGVKKGEDYKYNKVIQLNLNNFYFEEYEKTIDIFVPRNQDGIVLSDDIIFIQIYIPLIRKKWYTIGINNLTEVEKYIIGLVENDLSVSTNIGKDIKFMKEYVDEVLEVMNDNTFGESYDKEVANQEIAKKYGYESGYKEGRELGLEEGHQKGLKEGHQKGLEEGHQKGLEEGHQKGLEEGHQKGLEDAKIEIVNNLLHLGESIEKISQITGMSIDDIENIKK